MIGTEEVIYFLLNTHFLLCNLFPNFLSFWYCRDSEAVFAYCGFLDYGTMWSGR